MASMRETPVDQSLQEAAAKVGVANPAAAKGAAALSPGALAVAGQRDKPVLQPMDQVLKTIVPQGEEIVRDLEELWGAAKGFHGGETSAEGADEKESPTKWAQRFVSGKLWID